MPISNQWFLRFSECDEFHPCQGLGEHAHFRSFGMAFLTLFRIATGDNWNGIMKDTLREECEDGDDCLRNCCVSPYFAPLFFVVFVLMAQFVLVNVVVAVLMKHLEESHKQVRHSSLVAALVAASSFLTYYRRLVSCNTSVRHECHRPLILKKRPFRTFFSNYRPPPLFATCVGTIW